MGLLSSGNCPFLNIVTCRWLFGVFPPVSWVQPHSPVFLQLTLPWLPPSLVTSKCSRTGGCCCVGVSALPQEQTKTNAQGLVALLLESFWRGEFLQFAASGASAIVGTEEVSAMLRKAKLKSLSALQRNAKCHSGAVPAQALWPRGGPPPCDAAILSLRVKRPVLVPDGRVLGPVVPFKAEIRTLESLKGFANIY